MFSISILRHRGFWDNLSRQLQRRGPDYIKRCTFRNKPISTGNNAILPALFPPLVNEIQGSTPRIEVSEEDMKDVSGMAVTFQIQQLNLHVIDPFHACVRSLLMSQPFSRLTHRVTSLDKFVMLSQVSSSISA